MPINKDYIPAEQHTSDSAPVRKLVKKRPARKQVEHGQIEKKEPEQSGQTYNIWYHKWAGGDKYDSYNIKEKAQTRCVIATDAGYTRADANANNYCCLFFAKGSCPLGHECNYLHRLPLPDSILPDSSLDVFGREKHSDYRDDMGGVGSFNRQNRTLYIGRIRATSDIEQALERHFEEWGEIERIKVLHSRGVAFVTYVSELNAQFAKESMMHQSLDQDEILNVRWATEDPNPRAKVREAKRTKEIGEDGLKAKLTPDFVALVRQEDELNGFVEPLPEEEDDDFEQQQLEDGQAENGSSRSNKRQRLIEADQTISPQDQLPTSAASSIPTSFTTGILSQGVLQSLETLKKSNPSAINTNGGGLAGLAAYGSDTDDED